MKHYTDIELCPIWNFNKVDETDDARYLLILDNYNELPELNDKVFAVLEQAYIDILYQFPKNSINMDTIKLRYQLSKLNLKYSMYNHPADKVQIDKIEFLLQNQSKEGGNNDFFAEIIHLQQVTKLKIDIHKDSIKYFLKLREIAKRIIKENKLKDKRR